jgi:hypothetical protein
MREGPRGEYKRGQKAQFEALASEGKSRKNEERGVLSPEH